MRVHRFVLVVCSVLLVAMVPHAQATHDGREMWDPESIPRGTVLNFTETSRIEWDTTANGRYGGDEQIGSGHATGDFTLTWRASVPLVADNSTPEPDVKATARRGYEIRGVSTSEVTDGKGGRYAVTCRLDKKVDASVFGRETSLAMRGAWADNDTYLHVLLQSEMDVDLSIGGRLSDYVCTEQRTPNEDGGVPEGIGKLDVPEQLWSMFVLQSLVDEREGYLKLGILRQLGWEEARGKGVVLNLSRVVVSPQTAPPASMDRTLEMSGISGDGEVVSKGEMSDKFCNGAGHGSIDAPGVGRCRFSGELRVTTTLDPCRQTFGYAKAHFLELRKQYRELNNRSKASEKGLPEAVIIATSEDILYPLIREMLFGDRQFQLLACAGSEASYLEEAVPALEAVYRALEKTERHQRLTCPGVRYWVSIDKQLQLMSSRSSESSLVEYVRDREERGDKCVGPDYAYRVNAHVHSPVALHAFDLEGRHVGWDWTRGTAELGIPGATYDGMPNVSQSLDLPAGEYRLVVEELGPGNYSLGAFVHQGPSLTAPPAPVETREGHVLIMAVQVDEVDGEPVIRELGTWRGPRSAALAGFALTNATAPQLTATDAGAPTDAATTDAGPRVASAPTAGGSNDAPMPTFVLALALALALALRRR